METKKTIAFIPGAMRPPHKGHMAMIEFYAKMADETIVVLSNPKNDKSIRKVSDYGRAITPEQSRDILNIFLKSRGLLSDVKVVIPDTPSPIQYIYDKISELKDVRVILGVSTKEDIGKRYQKKVLDKLRKDNPSVKIVDPEKTAFPGITDKNFNNEYISATMFRNELDSPHPNIRNYMHPKMSDNDIRRVERILQVKSTSSPAPPSTASATNESETKNMSYQLVSNIVKNNNVRAMNLLETILQHKYKQYEKSFMRKKSR